MTKTSAHWITFFVILIGALILSWPLVYNGYPLIYPDTGSYITQALELDGIIDRPPYYALLIAPLHFGYTLWLIPFVQAALLSWLIILLVHELLPDMPRMFLVPLVLLLACGTSLPWHTSQIMPDIFTAAMLICYVLLLKPKQWFHRAALLLLLAISLCVHQSHMLLLLTLIIFTRLLQHVGFISPAKHFYKQVLVTLVLCVLAFAAYSTALVKRPMISLMGPLFLLARSIEDGPARAYLVEECPTPRYYLCTVLDRIPVTSNEFLWGDTSPIQDLYREKRFAGARDEAKAIMRGTLSRYFLWQLTASFKDFTKQLLRFRTGDFQYNYQSEDMKVTKAIARHFPKEFSLYLASKQVQGRLSLPVLGPLHVMMAIGSFLLILTLLAMKPVSPELRIFTALVFVLIVANAFISGALSEPIHRYGSRVIWLLPFTAYLLAIAPRPTPLDSQVSMF